MDDYSLILHEKLLFFGVESGSVIVFSHTTSDRSAEAAPLLASLHAPHHSAHTDSLVRCTHSDHKSIIVCYLWPIKGYLIAFVYKVAISGDPSPNFARKLVWGL